jgi:DNA-directed RNA polymerase subunit N (RpoN/RPB10)
MKQTKLGNVPTLSLSCGLIVRDRWGKFQTSKAKKTSVVAMNEKKWVL